MMTKARIVKCGSDNKRHACCWVIPPTAPQHPVHCDGLKSAVSLAVGFQAEALEMQRVVLATIAKAFDIPVSLIE